MAQRKRELDEGLKGGKSGNVTCKLCSQVGHNKRTCKNKTNETSTTTSSSHHPIQQQSTLEGSSSQPPPT
ncbi:hypothetical protein Ddye_027135 [Dipteronia dyeriana]|uniref:Uncharacterized protein n=1 Tax=Dipteronia dyeriana TaxID=168575 RepID=A0AAD9TPG6_9ROSI|nr:hypothetical protein Ddye_027135 [Dipteronia dyeriana]